MPGAASAVRAEYSKRCSSQNVLAPQRARRPPSWCSTALSASKLRVVAKARLTLPSHTHLHAPDQPCSHAGAESVGKSAAASPQLRQVREQAHAPDGLADVGGGGCAGRLQEQQVEARMGGAAVRLAAVAAVGQQVLRERGHVARARPAGEVHSQVVRRGLEEVQRAVRGACGWLSQTLRRQVTISACNSGGERAPTATSTQVSVALAAVPSSTRPCSSCCTRASNSLSPAADTSLSAQGKCGKRCRTAARSAATSVRSAPLAPAASVRR